jgi:hypothetical protein
MATTVIDLDTVKHNVLKELQRTALRPTELLNILGDKYSDVAVKEAVLRLLQERLIQMTPDRQLQLAEAA